MLQVRDVLKGTLKFSRTLLDETDDINISDNHYNMEVTRSPDSENSPEGAQTLARRNQETSGKGSERKHMFYMSSEENSEAMESPSEPNASLGTVNSFKLPLTREFEMHDYKVESFDSIQDKENRLHSGGPNVIESELSKSWSPDSERTTSSPDSEVVESPNPLYRIRHGSYNIWSVGVYENLLLYCCQSHKCFWDQEQTGWVFGDNLGIIFNISV